MKKNTPRKPRKSKTYPRNKEIYELRKTGLTYREIGEKYGFKRGRIHQIVKNFKEID